MGECQDLARMPEFVLFYIYVTVQYNMRKKNRPRKKIAPAKKIAPLFSHIYRYLPKGLEVFSLQLLSSFMFGLQDLEKKL